ncbi:MAG: DUF5107 domain-containing protein [Pirellulales bacterium]
MMNRLGRLLLGHVVVSLVVTLASDVAAEGKAWEGTVSIPTYPWEEDVNPKFWALEGGSRLSTTVKGSIIYPYTMQDHLSRTKIDRTYKALFLENEYLKVTCLPELGGRLHSVLDKTQNKQVFHLNHVIKPSMIAMRGAFISGGVEWNAGPHVHTVTIVSPVDALVGTHRDGSVFLEISNQEKIFRTRWTVRVTLRPGKAYLEEQITIYNPTDGMHPYYFWNCTAQPNRPGTRFIYPMSLGTDHNGREFFNWPIHEGKDLSWLKNYDTWASVFAVGCQYDFFGSYDVDEDRGCVQVANRHRLPGKKAWTWGTWDFGRVSQQNLTDNDGPYIEVQSGPLPTQSDYGMLAPRQAVSWKEWWYPVHGLADGFEYATQDVAVQTARRGGDLQLRIIATGNYPQSKCQLSAGTRQLVEKQIDLSPAETQTVTMPGIGDAPVRVMISDQAGVVLARFTTPLPIPKVVPPDPASFTEPPDEDLTVEQAYLKGRRFDRSTDRIRARRYYELALDRDAGHTASLRAMAVLDLEAGLYEQAAARLQKVLERDGDDGLAWYFLGVCHLAQSDPAAAVRCGFQAIRCHGTASLGADLTGRGRMRLGDQPGAARAFAAACRGPAADVRARNHHLLARFALGDSSASDLARSMIEQHPTNLVPRAILALSSDDAMGRFAHDARGIVGEYEFVMIETSLRFADLGLLSEAAKILRATCVDGVVEEEQSPLPHYYLAYFESLQENEDAARKCLTQAAALQRDFVFASRPEAVEVLKYAIHENPQDANAQFQLGNLYANLGRVSEAIDCWEQAVMIDPKRSIAQRNLGLAAMTVADDASQAADYYRKAIEARPDDQTLVRDLAEILIADGKRPEAIDRLETMPIHGQRRSEITIMLAQAYFDEGRYGDTIKLLESTPHFVNWEGQDITWSLFHRAHLERGQKKRKSGQLQSALADFEAALTYPANLGVGRTNEPQHAKAEFLRGETLMELGRIEEAKVAWKMGAACSPQDKEQTEYQKQCEERLKRFGI